MSIVTSVAQFLVFREKRKIAWREILREKCATKNWRKNYGKNGQKWPKIGQNWPNMAQYYLTNSFFTWKNFWISTKAILYQTRLPNWNSGASTYLAFYSKEFFFVNFSFFAKNVPIFIVFREKFQTRKMCRTNADTS